MCVNSAVFVKRDSYKTVRVVDINERKIPDLQLTQPNAEPTTFLLNLTAVPAICVAERLTFLNSQVRGACAQLKQLTF